MFLYNTVLCCEEQCDAAADEQHSVGLLGYTALCVVNPTLKQFYIFMIYSTI